MRKTDHCVPEETQASSSCQDDRVVAQSRFSNRRPQQTRSLFPFPAFFKQLHWIMVIQRNSATKSLGITSATTKELLNRAEDLMRQDWAYLGGFHRGSRPTMKRACVYFAVALVLEFALFLSGRERCHCGDSGLVTLNALTSQGIMTWPKITGSGHTFTCRPKWPPCGLIHASFGTSPLFNNK